MLFLKQNPLHARLALTIQDRKDLHIEIELSLLNVLLSYALQFGSRLIPVPHGKENIILVHVYREV